MLVMTPVVLLFQKVTAGKTGGLHTGFLLLFVCTLAGIFSVTGLPTMKYHVTEISLNVIPMVDILHSPLQYLLNVLLFIPVGFLLPLLWEKYGDWKHVLAFGGFLTVFVEIAQVFTFRTTDIDDLLTNLLGAALGFLMVRSLSGKLKIPVSIGWNEKSRAIDEPWIILILVFLIYFFIEPYWSGFFWDTVLM
jgi:glycopeptide antibiotics resistance protein